MSNFDSMTDWEKLRSMLQNSELSGAPREIDEEEMRRSLSTRVRGQDHVIDDLCRLIRVQWGKRERKRPIASVLFLGPTATGKTELAKAMAQFLFEDEKNLLFLNCESYSGAHSKDQLIGVPRGYSGWESGGQLTRPVIQNKRRLVLFDEVEKAYSGIFDLFLSMMGEGRLVEAGTEREADFTESIIVLTSNAEAAQIAKIDAQLSDPQEKANAIKQHLRDTNKFRAEILGRFDRIYVFRPLSGMINAEIAIIKMRSLAKEFGVDLAYVSPDLVFEAMQRSQKLKDFGTRELDRVINEMLGDAMLQARQHNVKRIKLRADSDGVLHVDPAD
ncbi:MAG: ATP-dependent Clp protease ATP-binding subunit [Tepidisphaera sp.]